MTPKEGSSVACSPVGAGVAVLGLGSMEESQSHLNTAADTGSEE